MRKRPDPWESGHVDSKSEVRSLEASIERSGSGWRIRIPLRQDQVLVERRVVAVKEINVTTRLVEETRVFDEVVAREKVSVEREAPRSP